MKYIEWNQHWVRCLGYSNVSCIHMQRFSVFIKVKFISDNSNIEKKGKRLLFEETITGNSTVNIISRQQCIPLHGFVLLLEVRLVSVRAHSVSGGIPIYWSFQNVCTLDITHFQHSNSK